MATIRGTSLFNRSNVSDTNSLTLNGAYGIESVTVGGNVFVFAAGLYDDGISSFRLTADGELVPIQSIGDSNALELDGAANFASAVVNGTTYLYVNGVDDDGISAFRVANDGSLTFVGSIADDAALQLDGTEGRMSVVTSGGNRFLVATGYNDDGFSVFRINANGTLSTASSVSDTENPNYQLNGAESVVTATIDGNTFIFIAGYGDDGLTSFRLNPNGSTVFADFVEDNSAIQLNGALDLATANVGGTTYLFASGTFDDGISVFQVNASGQMINVSNLSDDDGTLGLDRVYGLKTFQIGGQTYLAASGNDSNALTYFLVNDNGSLTRVGTVSDNAATNLAGSSFSTVATINGRTFLIGTGFDDDGLSVFEIGGGDDLLDGTGDADTISGLGGDDTLNGLNGDDVLDGGTGNDILNGGAGADTMKGGTGNDTYYVDNAGDQVIEANVIGIDTVNTTVSYSVASQFVENIRLLGTRSTNVIGNGLANLITGNSGNNALDGRGGADTMRGGAGNDTYYVDNLLDRTIEANGDGTDTVYTSVSKAFSDQFIEVIRLSGSANVNTTGNALANTIVGNGAQNAINGREGLDTLTGGLGRDTFVFSTALGSANIDRITDFSAADDTMQLENAIFARLTTTGTLDAAFFSANADGVAKDANDYIIYETDTGKVFYDADANKAGGASAVQFAQLGTTASHPTNITAADFLVV